ncbi:MAG TPA: hypothetical protein VF553_15350 [Pyrinomonadaceae bacterium]|jgi:uncharacterized repeat protein (TIGR01451 family)
MKTEVRSDRLKVRAILLTLALAILPALLPSATDSTALAAQQPQRNSNRATPRRARKVTSRGSQSTNQQAGTTAAQNANGASSNSNAQPQPTPYRVEAPKSDVKMAKVLSIGDKVLTDDMFVQPGTEITYTTSFINEGNAPSRSLSIIDPVQDMTDFKLDSVKNNTGTTGLRVTVSYSKDGGENCNYTPVSGGGGAPAGFDRLVNAVCLSFSGDLGYTPPNNAGSFSYVGRRR